MIDVRKLVEGRQWLIQGGVITPHCNHHAVRSITYGLEQAEPGVGLNFILTFFQEDGTIGNWVFDQEYTLRMGQHLEDHLEIVDRLYAKWKERNRKYYSYLARLEEKGIGDVAQEYPEFIEHYTSQYSAALFTDYFLFWSDHVVSRIASRLPSSQQSKLETLVMPVHKSFMLEEEESALHIGLDLHAIASQEGKGIGEITLEDLRRYPDTLQKLEQHQENFFWIQNNYRDTVPIGMDRFLNHIVEAVFLLNPKKITRRLEELEHYEENLKTKKRQIQAELDLPESDARILEYLSFVGWLHDARKKANLIGNYWTNRFIQKVAQETNTDMRTLQFMLPAEFLAFLKGKKVDMGEIRKRRHGSMFYVDKDGREVMVTGGQFEFMKKHILDLEIQIDMHDFRGTTASYGKTTGTVRIVLDPAEGKILPGEVLVAPMTRPEYVPLMKKARAIVTDEGGITSHAAIISRELGIPCIVGTRIATKVLKDGDFIEVNGNHGLVKILKRAKP